MNGPKNGIMLVIPIIQLISSVYSHPNIDMKMKHSIPIISESMILPFMNPPNVLFVKCAPARISSAVSFLKTDIITFFI